ncbi:hypothetical protein M9Y10_015807 [Tritrichomonas musculus]|uniref:Uncharacterized protein n=1 Tax=Tritrichomonas musculus TaxID=1915356 RepID=A0ABR2I6C9_9EUKA
MQAPQKITNQDITNKLNNLFNRDIHILKYFVIEEAIKELTQIDAYYSYYDKLDTNFDLDKLKDDICKIFLNISKSNKNDNSTIKILDNIKESIDNEYNSLKKIHIATISSKILEKILNILRNSIDLVKNDNSNNDDKNDKKENAKNNKKNNDDIQKDDNIENDDNNNENDDNGKNNNNDNEENENNNDNDNNDNEENDKNNDNNNDNNNNDNEENENNRVSGRSILSKITNFFLNINVMIQNLIKNGGNNNNIDDNDESDTNDDNDNDNNNDNDNDNNNNDVTGSLDFQHQINKILNDSIDELLFDKEKIREIATSDTEIIEIIKSLEAIKHFVDDKIKEETKRFNHPSLSIIYSPVNKISSKVQSLSNVL